MEAYPNTIKFYIDGTTPSPSVESRSPGEDSVSAGRLPCIDIDRPSPKPDKAHSKGAKRAGES